MSLNNQSACLADLGRREEALAAIEEAVTHLPRAGAGPPGRLPPDLATSLNNQSDRLADWGGGRRRWPRSRKPSASAASWPGPPGRLPPRPRHVAEQPVLRLADLGRREEALAAIEEAASIYRELARARPDAFRPDLAMSLNNQSPPGRPGRREEALATIEEAVTIRRELARPARTPSCPTWQFAEQPGERSSFAQSDGKAGAALAEADEIAGHGKLQVG